MLSFLIHFSEKLWGTKTRPRTGMPQLPPMTTETIAETRESRDAALARTIAEAVALQTKSIVEMFSKQKAEETQSIVEMFSKQKAEETQSLTEAFQRQMEKTHAQYEEILKASHAQNFPSTLKVTSSSEGFRVMDPFD